MQSAINCGNIVAVTPATAKLHSTLIRLFKGVITAWEEWLKSQSSK
jgi:hypothetical protein